MYSSPLPALVILLLSLVCVYIAARVDLSNHPIRHVFYIHRIAGVIGILLSVWDTYCLLSIDITLLPRDMDGHMLVPSSVYTPYAMYGAIIFFFLNAMSSIPLLLRVHQRFHGVIRMLFVGCLANVIMPLLVIVYVAVLTTVSARVVTMAPVWIFLTAATIVIAVSLCILIALTITNTYHAFTPVPVRVKPTIVPNTTPISTPSASPTQTTRKLTVKTQKGKQTSLAAAAASSPSIHPHKDFSISEFTTCMIRWMSSNGLPPWREYENDIVISRYATIIGTITIIAWTSFVMLTLITNMYINPTSNAIVATPTPPVWTTSHISLSALLFTQILHASIFSNNVSVFSFTMLFRGLVRRRIGLILYNLFAFPVAFVLTGYLVASFGQSTSMLDFVAQQFAYQPLSQCGII